MSRMLNPPDFQDDLNFVVTAQEAASWYGMTYQEIRADVEQGALAGRLSCTTWLVSVDSLFELYGRPAIAQGRRALQHKRRVKLTVKTQQMSVLAPRAFPGRVRSSERS